MKSVKPEAFDLKVIDPVISEIEIDVDVYGEPVSRYFCPAVFITNEIELKHPYFGVLVSAE